MNKIKNLFLAIAGVLILTASGYAQTTTTATTLSAAVTDTSSDTIRVASATGVTAGTTGIYVDREYMLVLSVSGTTVKVTRGAFGTSAGTHASGAPAFVGPTGAQSPFITADKAGTCTATNEAYLPQLNISNGKQFDCHNGVWIRISESLATLQQIISGSGATVTLTTDQSGATILLDRAAGITFTLPAPEPGLTYEFIASVSVTSNAYKFSTATQGTDFIVGDYLSIDTDTASAVVGFPCNGSTHDNFSMNGTTTGGLIGTRLKLTAISSTLWSISGFNEGSGVVATACSTT